MRQKGDKSSISIMLCKLLIRQVVFDYLCENLF